ncbi:MAG: hypothetical protein ACOC1F_08815 [Myxococcota bacterium]
MVCVSEALSSEAVPASRLRYHRDVNLRSASTLLLIALAGCRPSGRGRAASPVDPNAYPACDAPSDPYRPERSLPGPGAPLWIRRFGCQGDDRAMGLAIAPNGDVVATGSFVGRVSFGDRVLASGGARDAFVARWNAQGEPLWNVRLGGVNSEARGTNLAINARAEVLVAGRFHGVLDATRPQLLSRALDPFLVKVNSDGAFLWARRFDRAGTSGDGDVPFAPDPLGGALLAVGPTERAARDGFVSRIAAAGNLPGRVSLPDGHVSSVAVGADRSVVVAGHAGMTEAPASSGGAGRLRFRLRPRSQVDSLFVAKYDAGAERVWTRALGGRGTAFGEPLVAVDAAGGIYVAFAYRGAVDVGTGPVPASGGFDLALSKLDSTGKTIWTRAFPGPQGNEWMNALVVDAAGSVAIGGTFERAVDFGGGPIMSAGPISGYVARFDTLGRHQWSRVFGGQQSSAVVEDVAIGPRGQVAVAGAFKGWTDFGGGLVPASGAWDGFVAMLSGSDGQR